MLSIASLHEVFMHYFEKISSASGALSPAPPGSAPVPRWGTSILQTPSLPLPLEKILRGAHESTCGLKHTVYINYFTSGGMWACKQRGTRSPPPEIARLHTRVKAGVATGKPGSLRRPMQTSCVCVPFVVLGIEIEQGLTSHHTHYRSYRGRVFTGQMIQPTVSKH